MGQYPSSLPTFDDRQQAPEYPVSRPTKYPVSHPILPPPAPRQPRPRQMQNQQRCPVSMPEAEDALVVRQLTREVADASSIGELRTLQKFVNHRRDNAQRSSHRMALNRLEHEILLKRRRLL